MPVDKQATAVLQSMLDIQPPPPGRSALQAVAGTAYTVSSFGSLNDEDTFATFQSIESASDVSSESSAVAPAPKNEAVSPESRQLFREREESALSAAKQEAAAPLALSSDLRKRIRAYSALVASPNWVPFGEVEKADLVAERLDRFPFAFSTFLRYRRNAVALRVCTTINCPLSAVASLLSDHYLPLQMDSSLVRSVCVTAPSLPPREEGSGDTRRTVNGDDDVVRLYMFEKERHGAPAFDYAVAVKQLCMAGDEGSGYGLYTPGMPAACVLQIGRDASAEVHRDPLKEHHRARALVWGVLAVAIPSDASRVRLMYTVLMDFSGTLKKELSAKTCTAMAQGMVHKMRTYAANIKAKCEAMPVSPPLSSRGISVSESDLKESTRLLGSSPTPEPKTPMATTAALSTKAPSPVVEPASQIGSRAQQLIDSLAMRIQEFNTNKTNHHDYVYRTTYKSAYTTIVFCEALLPRTLRKEAESATATAEVDILLTVVLNVSMPKWQQLVQRQGSLYKLPFLASRIARVEPLGCQLVQITQKGKEASAWVEASGPPKGGPKCFYIAQQQKAEKEGNDCINGFAAVSLLRDPQYIKVSRCLRVTLTRADFEAKTFLKHKEVAAEVELLILLKNYTCELS